ncbi:MAG: glycoside hydrolase family 127 protein [Spirochaetaceae bacterium]|jgi:DUF1680 family protein|nr:glycoside hydrolase family 127 protein [Spirochaetaceae bacterium]
MCEWQDGDKLRLSLDMPVMVMESNPHVQENRGKLFLMRGPVVCCLEEKDNGNELFRLYDNYEEELLEGIDTISFTGKSEKDWQDESLYLAMAR